jgi:hypothetical protein
MSDRLNLGELRQRGTLLFTREAATVLYEVCCRLTEAEEEGPALAAPSPEQLWVTADGHLVMNVEPRGAEDLAQSTMDGLAGLIEALLPPTMLGTGLRIGDDLLATPARLAIGDRGYPSCAPSGAKYHT